MFQLMFSVFCIYFLIVDLNLLDWSVNNQLAVALGGHLYLWNAGTGQITQLTEMEGPEAYISSVSWVKEGNFLAVGTSEGAIEVSIISAN